MRPHGIVCHAYNEMVDGCSLYRAESECSRVQAPRLNSLCGTLKNFRAKTPKHCICMRPSFVPHLGSPLCIVCLKSLQLFSDMWCH